jgi:hypothetical protein
MDGDGMKSLALLGLVCCMVGAARLTDAADERRLLVTKVAWSDDSDSGNAGTSLFQGEIVAGVLTGRVYPGDGTELVASGTVSSTGAVSGTLKTVENLLVSTFSAQLGVDQALVGEVEVDGNVAASWTAPASQLATE